MTALRFSTPLAQRDPSESQGCHPVTTLKGSFFGAVKWDLKPSMNMPSKSRGNSTAESCAATDILTIVVIESLDWRVSRQPRVAEIASRADAAVRGEGLLEQETAVMSAARSNADERRRNC